MIRSSWISKPNFLLRFAEPGRFFCPSPSEAGGGVVQPTGTQLGFPLQLLLRSDLGLQLLDALLLLLQSLFQRLNGLLLSLNRLLLGSDHISPLLHSIRECVGLQEGDLGE